MPTPKATRCRPQVLAYALRKTLTEHDPSARPSPEHDIALLIGRGESDALEFKSSLRYDLETKQVNKELTKTVAKVVAGFLNTHGGILLIGVVDDGTITGLEADLRSLSKKNLDGFELTLRNAVGTFLGVAIGPHISVAFPEVHGNVIAHVTCPPYTEPVFLREGDQYHFFVRDGNQTRPLNIQEGHAYIRNHWTTDTPVTIGSIRQAVSDVLQGVLGPGRDEDLPELEIAAPADPAQEAPGGAPLGGDMPPPWLRVGTRRVLDLFLSPLARSPGWKRLFLVSPWISDIGSPASMTFDQLLKRVTDDGTTVYLVTRPPEHDWHERAITRLGETGRANVALVPDLHVKLYTALTDYGSFALLASANFTQQSLANREIGLLINSYGDGRRVVSDLNYEASQIYRLDGRRLIYQASFAPK